jgi:hypothetical protein
MGITYTGQAGYISAQPKVGAGIVDSIFAGENAIHEPDGWRVFNGWKQIDPARTVPTLGYTATLTAGGNIATLAGGSGAPAHQDEWDPGLLCSSYAIRASFNLPGGQEIFESLETDHIVHEGWSK